MVALVRDLRWDLDRDSASLFLLLDLSVVFKTIDLCILLTSLLDLGVGRMVVLCMAPSPVDPRG